MKITWNGALFYATALAISGCKKDEKPIAVQIQVIDASQLRPAFSSAAPESRAMVDDVMMAIQDSEHPKALANLETLSKMPSLTETQRQVIANLAGQIKKRRPATQPKE
jgi:hypothetical protein